MLTEVCKFIVPLDFTFRLTWLWHRNACAVTGLVTPLKKWQVIGLSPDCSLEVSPNSDGGLQVYSAAGFHL
jgi:hypothetical protein